MLEIIIGSLIYLIGFIVAMVLCLVSDKGNHVLVGEKNFEDNFWPCFFIWWIILPCFILEYSYINIQKFCIYLANKF